MPVSYGSSERAAAAILIGLSHQEDLGGYGDLTCQTTIPESQSAEVDVVSRADGVFAGGPLLRQVCDAFDSELSCEVHIDDGAELAPGTVAATISGRLRSLLVAERTALNFLTHLCGVATLTHRFVAAVGDSRAKVLDTRKTLPGWRALQKYAVRCGGGVNHRFGLYDGVIIKDNHVAAWDSEHPGRSLADLVTQVKERLPVPVFVELEVDSLDQFRDALPGEPDWVLLDNFTNDQLREAVAIRDESGSPVMLEASGGVRLDTVAGIAETGVDRISVGALTHSAVALDLGFDWKA